MVGMVAEQQGAGVAEEPSAREQQERPERAEMDSSSYTKSTQTTDNEERRLISAVTHHTVIVIGGPGLMPNTGGSVSPALCPPCLLHPEVPPVIAAHPQHLFPVQQVLT